MDFGSFNTESRRPERGHFVGMATFKISSVNDRDLYKNYVYRLFLSK